MDNSASPLTCSGAYAFGGKMEMHMMWSGGLSLAAKLLAKSSETPRMVRRYFMIAIHPGEILREEYMAPLGLTASTLALKLRIPASRVHEIINEKRGISGIRPCGLQNFLKLTLICGSICRRSMKRIRWTRRSARIWNGLFHTARCRGQILCGSDSKCRSLQSCV